MSPVTTGLHDLADGTTGRIVLVCHPSAVADPDPEATWSRGVTLIGVTAETPVDEIVSALDRRAPGVIGAAGWSTGGLTMLRLAAARPDLIDRLVLVATPLPDDRSPDPATITAKTLLLYGAQDPDAPSSAGKWYQRRLPTSRYEQVPGTGALLLESMWHRVLSHLAPNRRR